MKEKEEEDPTVPYVLSKDLDFKIRLVTLPSAIKETLGGIAVKMTKDIALGKNIQSLQVYNGTINRVVLK